MPVIKKPSEHFDVSLWTGDGTTSPRSITNAGGFQPDLVWSKDRTSAYNHQLFDSVRGVGSSKNLMSNQTAAEGTNASSFGYLSAFNSNGFALTKGTDPGNEYLWVGKTSDNYVAWQWKAGGAAVANTSGSISSQVSVNSTAGFSVVTWTGNGTSGATVGHGLGVAPSMIIVKSRSATTSWFIRHSSLTAGYQLRFTTDAQEQVSSATTAGGLGSGTSSVINFIAGSINVDNVNASAATYVAYCFAPVAGYSAFGSYTGNGSNDGPFIFTGFRPKFVMIKSSSTGGSGYDWFMWDSSRNTYNVVTNALWANLSDAENNTAMVDLVSNGFKLRLSSSAMNGSGTTFIYMAFAENPFKYANAR